MLLGSKVVCLGQPNHLSAIHSQLQEQNRDKQKWEEGFPAKKKWRQKKAENGQNVKISNARNVRNAVLGYNEKVVDHR